MNVETCPLLEEFSWLRHGFFGNDNPHAVTNALIGHHRFSDDFPDALFLRQDHTDMVVTDYDDPLARTADAVITTKENLGLAIKTADCCPVLLADPVTRQIAVVHAGWPGALNGITLNAVKVLTDQGAESRNIIAAIGPSIHATTYPVRDDVRDRFQASRPEALTHFTRFEDRWKMDVSGIVTEQLRAAGVTRIWQSRINTFEDKHYASYRRDGRDPALQAKRNVSIIMITP